MKTTLTIDDSVMRQLKLEAARQKRTMSEMVETALRMLLQERKSRGAIAPLPTFKSKGALVNIAGNLVHDTHTAILMREHGIRRIYTRDTDFHRFPFLEPIDPLA